MNRPELTNRWDLAYIKNATGYEAEWPHWKLCSEFYLPTNSNFKTILNYKNFVFFMSK